jgi:predicted trehalose synthase
MPARAASAPEHEALVRAQHRMALEIRALTVSLRAALADLSDDPKFSVAERIAQRRVWCDDVAILLQDIRIRSMQISRLVAGDADIGIEPIRLLDAAEADLQRLRGVA